MPTDKNIESPEHLWGYFGSYKKECKANPKKDSIYNYKSEKHVSLDREIPLTWNGFEIHLHKLGKLKRLQDYKANKDGRYKEYAYILSLIDRYIYEDKYTGAVAGVFNHNIIARDLGLVDKQENKVEIDQPLFPDRKDKKK